MYCLTSPEILLTTNIHFLYTRLPKAQSQWQPGYVDVVKEEGGIDCFPSFISPAPSYSSISAPDLTLHVSVS